MVTRSKQKYNCNWNIIWEVWKIRINYISPYHINPLFFLILKLEYSQDIGLINQNIETYWATVSIRNSRLYKIMQHSNVRKFDLFK